jgi:hypothetical protein
MYFKTIQDNNSSIEDIHYELMVAIKLALENLSTSSINIAEKEKKIKYLQTLQNKIINSPEIVEFFSST